MNRPIPKERLKLARLIVPARGLKEAQEARQRHPRLLVRDRDGRAQQVFVSFDEAAERIK